MRTKAAALIAALLLLTATNLHLYCAVTVGGRRVPGLFRPQDAERCAAAAQALAEELAEGEAALPPFRQHWRLRLCRPTGDLRELTEAVLDGTGGVVLADGVFVNGEALGTVEDAGTLYEKLRYDIDIQMPTAAVAGNLGGQLRFRKVYSRQGHETRDEDMILLITGMAPVFYVDANGKLA